jgi:hypothetical protein
MFDRSGLKKINLSENKENKEKSRAEAKVEIDTINEKIYYTPLQKISDHPSIIANPNILKFELRHN